MRNQITRTLGLVAAGLLIAGSAQAQGKGHDHKGKHDDVTIRHGAIRRGDIDRDHDRDHDRDRDIFRDDRHIPPGLAKKPGQMPPGQYKKLYRTYDGASVLGQIMRQRGYNVMRIVPSGDSHLVYYRYHDGAEQRGIVRPGTDRLQFSNVPASLVQAVLARLY